MPAAVTGREPAFCQKRAIRPFFILPVFSQLFNMQNLSILLLLHWHFRRQEILHGIRIQIESVQSVHPLLRRILSV